MNILFYTYWEISTENGGTERITANIADVLRKDYGHKCYSLYSRPLDPSFPRAPFDARFRLGFMRRRQTIADLSRFIHEKRIDVIVCNSDFAM